MRPDHLLVICEARPREVLLVKSHAVGVQILPVPITVPGLVELSRLLSLHHLAISVYSPRGPLAAHPTPGSGHLEET